MSGYPQFQRGTTIGDRGRFWTVDPQTGIQTLSDPDQITVTVEDPDGVPVGTFTYGTDANVSRLDVGEYLLVLDPQLPVGIYHVRWDGVWVDSSLNPTKQAAAENWLEVIESGVLDPDPPTVPVTGPCAPWISGQDVANCARVDYSQAPAVFDTVAIEAGAALYEISGRMFPGVCDRTVRPARGASCGHWSSAGPLSYGMGPWFWTTVPWGFGGAWAWYNESGDKFGCQPMSRVKLAGYPIREITAVTIDGVDLPEFDPLSGARNWRLDNRRYLTRMDNPGDPAGGIPAFPQFWPGCQNLSLDPDQPGTFEVAYKWGIDPPQLGRDAAVEIANQLYLACGGAQCVLPAGVTRVTRQGIEIERGLLANWADPTKPTGLVNTDLFLISYWKGQRGGRRSMLWSPDMQQYALRLGR